MTLARLGDESSARFGEYEALAFEGRRLTNVDRPARPVGWLTPSATSGSTRTIAWWSAAIGKILRKDLRREAHTPS